MRFLIYLATLPLLFQVTPLSANYLHTASDQIDPPSNQHLVVLRRNQGETIATKTSYTTLEALSFPKNTKELFPFADFRVHVLDKDSNYAANIGFGVRFRKTCSNQIFGVNAYYDLRKAHRCHYNQVGLGFELLGKCWNFRLNGYLPVGRKKTLDSCCFFNRYIGDYFFLKQTFVDSLKGVDFEVESVLGRCCWGDLYLGIGSYYYRSNKCHKNIYGSEYRLTADFCNYFSFTFLATYDCVFKTRIMGQLSFFLPFYFQCGQGATLWWGDDPELFRPVRRQELILLKKRNRFIWNF